MMALQNHHITALLQDLPNCHTVHLVLRDEVFAIHRDERAMVALECRSGRVGPIGTKSVGSEARANIPMLVQGRHRGKDSQGHQRRS